MIVDCLDVHTLYTQTQYNYIIHLRYQQQFNLYKFYNLHFISFCFLYRDEYLNHSEQLSKGITNNNILRLI